jgi:hypothetical protein
LTFLGLMEAYLHMLFEDAETEFTVKPSQENV